MAQELWQKELEEKRSYAIENYSKDKVKTFVEKGIDNGYNILLTYITKNEFLKIPVWFGMNSETYQTDKERLIQELNNKNYGYGILLGKQPNGQYLVCIDVDVNNTDENHQLDNILENIRRVLNKNGIEYCEEETYTGRYHIYIAVDKLTNFIQSVKKIPVENAYKYRLSTKVEIVQGGVEILSTKKSATVYNGIINELEPFFTKQLKTNSYVLLENALKELTNAEPKKSEKKKKKKWETVIDTYEELEYIAKAYSIIRKYEIVNGWDIDKTFSTLVAKANLDEQLNRDLFKIVYEEEYDEFQTDYIVANTKEKLDDEHLPTIGSVIYHFREAVNSSILTLDERYFLKEVLSRLEQKEVESVLNASRYILLESNKYKNEHGQTLTEEKYFIEVPDIACTRVDYKEIVFDEDGGLYGKHIVKKYEKCIGVAVDFIRRVASEDSGRFFDYQIYLSNEKVIVRSKMNFKNEDDAINEIWNESRVTFGGNKALYKKYLNEKIKIFYSRHYKHTHYISKRTGWSKNFDIFFHYAMDQNYGELSEDHILFRHRRNVVANKDKQHEIIYDLLQEGRYLGLMLVASVSSILISPLLLQPLTFIITGTAGVGKTTSSLFACSPFYLSNDVLITANTTKVALELMLSSLNSLPLLIDEGAMKTSLDLQDMVFTISGGKGKARGTKTLSVNLYDLQSNVFYTSETTDIDEIRRAGAFRRIIHLSVDRRELLTNRTDIDKKLLNKVAGCGIDYINYAVQNINNIKQNYQPAIDSIAVEYEELFEVARNMYAGLVFLEEYYNTQFHNLRKLIDHVLKKSLYMFTRIKQNAIDDFFSYINANYMRFAVVKEINRYDKEGNIIGTDEIIERYPNGMKEALGEHNIKENKLYITAKAMTEIAKEIEKDRNLLIEELFNQNYLENRESKHHYFRFSKQNVRAYTIDYNIPDTNEPSPFDPSPENDKASNNSNEPDDFVVDAFSTLPSVKSSKTEFVQQKKEEIQDFTITTNSQEKESTMENNSCAKVDPSKKEIIIDEELIDIFDVKPKDTIPECKLSQRNIKAFSDLLIGVFDIETGKINENGDDEDTLDPNKARILATAFNIYKGQEKVQHYRFYLDNYPTEQEMVNDFINKLKESNIDVLTGYNLYDFDLKFIKAKDVNNRLFFTEEKNIANALRGDKQLTGYNIKIDNEKFIEVIDTYPLVIKYDMIARDIEGQSYSLKNVAKHFKIAKEDRVILSPELIKNSYYTNRELFDAYLDEDIRECYEIFRRLATPYYYMRSIAPFKMSFFDAFRSSTAAVWERILEEYYKGKTNIDNIQPDKKMRYEGGLVIVNKGLYKNVYKIDVASLYPNIMLNYQICSRKDTEKMALAILQEYTNMRLELKKKAKNGDIEADMIQGALKILINSLYGFYGTGGYKFNDMTASAMITAYGRKILKYMIEYIEHEGGTIIECDTDGIYFSSENGREIYEKLKQEMNKINFDIELEYEDCIMFASDKKNYILITQDGKVKRKGSKWAGRDKSNLYKEFTVEYIKRYIENKEQAEDYKKEIRRMIESGKAYDLVKITKKIGKAEKSIISYANSIGMKLSQGDIVTVAYKDFRKKTFAIEPDNRYDIKYYLAEFDDLIKEIDNTIHSTANIKMQDIGDPLPSLSI